jgi:alpha-glucosidase
MFTSIIQLLPPVQAGDEHIWRLAEEGRYIFLAGSVLGGEIVRIRLVRGAHDVVTRYQLVDGMHGTLPYHSWIVVKGDEYWSMVEDVDSDRNTIGTYLQGFAYSETELRLTRPLADGEQIYGLGEHTGALNQRGQAFPIWNVDPPQRHDSVLESMYTSIPFYVSLNGTDGQAYGVLIDNTGYIAMDLGKTQSAAASITVRGDNLVVYFLLGPTLADVLRQYTELTGHMPLPARWTLGYHQCRWGYKSELQVHEVATRMREREHPCDGIWLDIDYMDGYRNFTWHPGHFPDAKKLAQELHAEGFHLVSIIDPGTKIDRGYRVYQEGMQQGYFCSYQNGKIFEGSVWPGMSVFPDFSRAEVRTWWGNLYKTLLDQGVDGFWNDMNEPALTNFFSRATEDEPSIDGTTMDKNVLHRAGGDQPEGPDGPPVLHQNFHNAYGMEMARATFEGLQRLRPNTRPFVLTRSGTAGVQRYAAVWTGDNTSKWEHIALAIRMCLNLGMSGVPFVGADIGGFWDASNGELLVRFVQMGALLPFSRNHNALGNPGQEPWAFGETYENAYRKAIEVRYQLLPYLYNLFRQASVDGSPIMRPLYYHYPQNEQASANAETEFLVGDTLLSAPILEEETTGRSVYLPEGTWFDYWDGTLYEGNATYNIAAPLDRWPLFVHSNRILPGGPIMQYVDQRPTDPLTFTCYMTPDGHADYVLYEDDGSTQDYRNGAFALTSIHCAVKDGAATVSIDEQYEGYRPRRGTYEIVVRLGDRVLGQQRVQAGQGHIEIKF